MTQRDILERIYVRSLDSLARRDESVTLPDNIKHSIDIVFSYSESNKAVLTVLITLLCHKIFKPTQDIRYHQAQLPNGFSGRTIDKEYVTPFMKRVQFPSMAESGWLTRSLEQPHPYTMDYPGKIKSDLKESFLTIIDAVQTKNAPAENILFYLFILLIKQRDSLSIELAKPHSLSIASIIDLLKQHFNFNYAVHGAARLPTLAVYAAYQCMMKQVSRYEDKALCPLESHNSADTQSGRIGDIDVINPDGSAFEGVEIKHLIAINPDLVRDAYEKFKTHRTDRYYLLTTSSDEITNREAIEQEILRINRIHGCQVIVNGVYSSLKYYLRLLKDPAEFVSSYVELLKQDPTIKYAHKDAWNSLVNKGI